MTSDERRVLDAVPDRLLIGGAWRDAGSGGRFAVENPATEEVIGEVADATPGDALDALGAAAAGQEAWGRSAPQDRAAALMVAAGDLEARRDELALLMALEMGKPLAHAAFEADYAVAYLRWYAGEAVRVAGRFQTSPDGGRRILVMRGPAGPALIITPWNWPLVMAAREVAAALAAGCAVVVRPSRETPYSTLALAAALQRAGLPDGVLNVVTSAHAGAVTAPLIADPRLRVLAFTGSTEVGRMLMSEAAAQTLRLSMELGGNAPFIVFADADLDAALDGAVQAKVRNDGESCTAANRFLVAHEVAAEFAERLAARLGALKVGPGTDPTVEMGPLVDAAQRDKVAELVDDAVAGGARVLTGGRAPDGPGWFYLPTVLVDVPPDARLLSEEIFGPVAPVVPFADEAEALAAANATEFGLVAFVYTRDLDRALRMVEDLDVGMVAVNQGTVSNVAAPFGGVKHSGFGRKGGAEGIEEYLELKYVSLQAER